MHRLRATIPIFLLYLLISTNFEWRNMIVGALLAIFVTWLLQLQPQQMAWQRVPIALWAGLRYFALLMWELFSSGIQVARIVLDPKLPIQPGVIAIPSGTQSEQATALSAHSITLTPGEMVVMIDENNVMYTHCLDVSKADDLVTAAQARRRDLLDKIFV
jgi:multicomponent Na+:H+ antiporter subunit E